MMRYLANMYILFTAKIINKVIKISVFIKLNWPSKKIYLY